jgi:excinuclease ABC subunit B
MNSRFKLATDFTPSGDQPQAIESLTEKIQRGNRHQTLLGVTGSGKTFTMANVVERTQLPTLVMAPNKTLAAQLYGEFKSLFPDNAVEFFVSYYDYYQPEAYLPAQDLYIEKDSSINDRIDRLRHSATNALLMRKDVIIIASVSCIYGLGDPNSYRKMILYIEKGVEVDRDKILRKLVDLHYMRNDLDFHRGTFRVRGDVVEVFPVYEDEKAIRIEFFGDEIEALSLVDPLRGRKLANLESILVPPASHYATPKELMDRAVVAIQDELQSRLAFLKSQNKLVEAQRLEQRTMFDIEMIEEMGYCTGIENYSRHLTGRASGEPPPTLFDYFPDDFLLMVDESHVSIPQIGGMYKGDRSRKQNLVEHGFRLPSALDNRPLRFDEFEERIKQAVYVSATPGRYELEKAKKHIVEQIIRPTGLIDPAIEIRPASTQVDDLLEEVRSTIEHSERVLITTLTKRMAEDLTRYYSELGLKVQYLHSDVKTLERIQIINDLRKGEYDILVGINLLREGLDLPEVRLVAVLDADKEGFLRSETSLIQTSGRAARNVNGRVIMYADRITGSIKRAVDECDRRRKIQLAYNVEHGITPESIKKNLSDALATISEMDYASAPMAAEEEELYLSPAELEKRIKSLQKKMLNAAADLAFEEAAECRDEIKRLQDLEMATL